MNKPYEPTEAILELLDLLSQGYNVNQISEKLNIERTSVSQRLWRIRKDLGLTNFQVAMWFCRNYYRSKSGYLLRKENNNAEN